VPNGFGLCLARNRRSPKRPSKPRPSGVHPEEAQWKEDAKVLSRGYDWANSVFDDPSTQFLKGVIYFSLGDYESRKYVFNPKFVQTS